MWLTDIEADRLRNLKAVSLRLPAGLAVPRDRRPRLLPFLAIGFVAGLGVEALALGPEALIAPVTLAARTFSPDPALVGGGLLALAVLARGSEDAWNAFLASQQNGFWISFHAAALIYFLVFMTFDWFKLAPKAMPLQIGEDKIPAGFIVAGHYVAWVLVTAFVFWLAGVI